MYKNNYRYKIIEKLLLTMLRPGHMAKSRAGEREKEIERGERGKERERERREEKGR